jgi:hypothetical protein
MKKCEFSRDQNKNLWISSEQLLRRCVLTYLHEIFFGEILIILFEWLDRLAEKNRTFCIVVSRNWTHDLIHQVNTTVPSHTMMLRGSYLKVCMEYI